MLKDYLDFMEAHREEVTQSAELLEFGLGLHFHEDLSKVLRTNSEAAPCIVLDGQPVDWPVYENKREVYRQLIIEAVCTLPAPDPTDGEFFLRMMNARWPQFARPVAAVKKAYPPERREARTFYFRSERGWERFSREFPLAASQMLSIFPGRREEIIAAATPKRDGMVVGYVAPQLCDVNGCSREVAAGIQDKDEIVRVIEALREHEGRVKRMIEIGKYAHLEEAGPGIEADLSASEWHYYQSLDAAARRKMCANMGHEFKNQPRDFYCTVSALVWEHHLDELFPEG